MKYTFLLIPILLITLYSCDKSANESSGVTGQGGSMARFTISNNFLYVIDDRDLKVFDINQVDNPTYVKSLHVGFNIETIFPHNNHLFVGSQNGMYIYDITQPENPQFVSDFVHIVSCDPVVVNDTLAFITLRSGSDCRVSLNVNQLEIIDISKINTPELLKVVQMDTPHGLAIDDTLLFICHGQFGLGIYDISDIDQFHSIFRINAIHAYDVIPRNKTLFVIGENGFYQYSYHNIDSIYLMSHIPITP